MPDVPFLIATALLLAAPGPTNALLMAAGASHDVWRPAAPLFAVISAYMVSISLIGFGLAPVIAAVPVIGPLLKAVAALWLILCALRLWRRSRGEAATAAISQLSLFIATALNPKGLIIALALLPTGWAAETGIAVPHLTALLLLITGTSLAWSAAGRVAAKADPRIRQHAPRATALALGGFAILMLRSALAA